MLRPVGNPQVCLHVTVSLFIATDTPTALTWWSHSKRRCNFVKFIYKLALLARFVI